MARHKKYRLTWCGKERRWRKRYKKKTYNFPLRAGETKEQSYRRCWAEFQAIRARVDQDQYQEDREHWETQRELFRLVLENPSFLLSENSHLLVGRLGRIARLGKLGVVGYQWALKERIRLIDNALAQRQAFDLSMIMDESHYGPLPFSVDDVEEAEPTLAASIRRFLEAKESTVSVSRWNLLRTSLRNFQASAGGDTPLNECDARILDSYLVEVRSSPLSPYTKRDRLSAVKHFYQWLYDREIIAAKPRLLESSEWSVKVAPSKIKVFTDDEVRQLLAAAPPRVRLYILLGLNCGFTQKDISDLRPCEVSWSDRTITRRRSKTGDHENVPTVTYPLWDETFELLSSERSDHPRHVLTNRSGQPLVVQTLVHHQSRKSDHIGNVFDRLRRKLQLAGTFKWLRKTAATKLKTKGEFRGLVELFLGHAPSTIADRHYAEEDCEQFTQAVLWLREPFLADRS